MRKLLILIATLITHHSCFSQTLTTNQIHRIGDYGKLWSVLRLFHPGMAYGKINEDSLFTDNIGALLKDPSAENFKNAVAKMLDRLHDPYTAIEDTAKNTNESIALPKRPLLQWHEDSVVSVYFDNNFVEKNYDDNGNDTPFLRLIDTLKKARGVIIDLRNASDKYAGWSYMLTVEKLFSYLTDKDLRYPSFRTRIHYGHESEYFDMSSFYYQGWFLRNTFVNKRRKNAIHKPVCLLINRFNANISFPIAAMQQDGNALVIADDSLGDKFDHTSTYLMQLTDNIKVNIGTGEAVYHTGKTFSPDITVPRTNSGHDSSLLALAVKSFHNKSRITQRQIEPLSILFETAKVEGYDSLTYPPAQLRLLGLMRYWSAITYFCPNKDRIIKNWDSVLYEYVPKFLAAKDSLDYIKAVGSLITEIHDGHGRLGSKVWDKMYQKTPGLQVKYVENKTIVNKIFDDSLKNIFSPGDEIIKVDNVEVNKLRSSFAHYIGASNNAALQRSVSRYLLSGPDSSTVKITFLHDATTKNIQIKRNRYINSNVSDTKKEEPVWKKINSKTGYIDFGRLEVSQVDSVFSDLQNTDQIIIDNRSYPRGTVWTLVNYLTDKPVTGAIGTTMIADSPDPLAVTIQKKPSQIQVTPMPKLYKGRLIILVNEATISQAEYSCMVLQAASKKVTVIGSQTAGADGDVTGIKIPGGIVTNFSGRGVYYPDGRPTQGIGIVPDIKIYPTIKGIKAGRDEVLERAIEFAKSGK